MLLEDKINEYVKLNKPIKLHLGCGPFVFEDYINVDGEYLRATAGPEITIYDITNIPYPVPDNSVDEILTVHVIEHIERWEVDALLQEWLRILKPGGKVVIEWPDLLKACKLIVKDPYVLDDPGKHTKLEKHTINAIFGNPRFKHRAMMHAFGYSEKSLAKILINLGFSSAVAEENLHRKTLADSRIVGIK